MAGTPLRRLDHPPGLGAGDPRAAGGLLRQRLRIGDPRRAPSDLSHDFARFAAAAVSFREGALFPDMPRQGQLAERPGADASDEPHHLRAAAGARPRRPRRSGRGDCPRGSPPLGAGRPGRQRAPRHGHPLRLQPAAASSRSASATRVTCAGSPPWSHADTAADGFSARRLDWRYLTEPDPVPGPRPADPLRPTLGARLGGALAPRGLSCCCPPWRAWPSPAPWRSSPRSLPREVEGEAVDVGHRVVIADQAEVDLAVVGHDPDAPGAGPRHHREDRLILRPST